MKWLSHLTVVLLIILCVMAPNIPVASTKADTTVPAPTPSTTLLSSVVSKIDLDRSDLSERGMSTLPVLTPLPMPVPVDPNATPLPVPSPPSAPVAFIATTIPTNGGMLWPFAGSVVQYFSIGHPAMDILAPCGTPIAAGYSGEVIWSGWRDNGGGFVVGVLAENGLLIEYNHLSATAVASGYVAAGQVIGYVGMTGWATGCHVHLAVMEAGVYTDPMRFLSVL